MVATEFKRAEVIERLDLPNRLGREWPTREVPITRRDHGVFARHGCRTFHGGRGIHHRD